MKSTKHYRDPCEACLAPTQSPLKFYCLEDTCPNRGRYFCLECATETPLHQHQPSQTAIELSKITQDWGDTLGDISGLEKRVARESADYASLIRVLDK